MVPNQFRKGSQLNQSILDERGMLAIRTLATGMFSGLTDPATNWFNIGLKGQPSLPDGPEKKWLANATSILHEIYGGSNFYETMAQAFWDECAFGTGVRIQLEDPKDVVRFYNPPLGSYFLGVNNRREVDTYYEEYTYTVKQTVDEFGIDAVSESTRQMYRTPSSQDTELVICRAIEPNTLLYHGGAPVGYAVPRRFAYREYYWEQVSAGGTKGGHITKVQGFMESPIEDLRWSVTGNDPYGRGPGMDALPATLQLQIEQKRKAEAIDKMVRPPMVAPVSMKNEPTDTLPGGVTYTNDPNAGFKPAFQVEPRIQEMSEDINEVADRIEKTCFVPLFAQFPTDTVRTATEVEAIKAEKVVLLGPVIERNQNALARTITRTFKIAQRRGLIPPAPQAIHGAALEIRYISMLAELQQSSTLTSIERLWQFTGGIGAAKPEAFDKLDADMSIELYADGLTADPRLIVDPELVAAIRHARAQSQQAQAALQVGAASAQVGQTLSQTQTGGGKSALESMLGSGGAVQ